MAAAGRFFAELGGTIGAFIPYECPRCKTTRPISEYYGDVVNGSTCPNCGEDPRPQGVSKLYSTPVEVP